MFALGKCYAYMWCECICHTLIPINLTSDLPTLLRDRYLYLEVMFIYDWSHIDTQEDALAMINSPHVKLFKKN